MSWAIMPVRPIGVSVGDVAKELVASDGDGFDMLDDNELSEDVGVWPPSVEVGDIASILVAHDGDMFDTLGEG